MGEYALVTAAVATLAISLATIPAGELGSRLPTTEARARALVTRDARTHGVPVAVVRKALAHAPYTRAPLRYLYAAGWVSGRKSAATCVLAKVSEGDSARSLAREIRRNRRLVIRLRRMKVTPAQASVAVVRGTAAAC